MTVIQTCQKCHRKIVCLGRKDEYKQCSEENRKRYPDLCNCPICYPKSPCITEFLKEKPRKGRLIGGYSIQ